jgi:hypothetical protein
MQVVLESNLNNNLDNHNLGNLNNNLDNHNLDNHNLDNHNLGNLNNNLIKFEDNWQNVKKMRKDYENIKGVSAEDIILIQPNDVVRICNGYEQIYVKIENIDFDKGKKQGYYRYSGIILNELVLKANYQKGSKIHFGSNNIHQIYKLL